MKYLNRKDMSPSHAQGLWTSALILEFSSPPVTDLQLVGRIYILVSYIRKYDSKSKSEFAHFFKVPLKKFRSLF